MYDRFKNFTVFLLRINRSIQRLKSETMREVELKGTHVSCLYYLYKEGALTATELCEISGEDKSYISHTLRYLEDNGYVLCDSKAKKRYNATFVLTERGQEAAVVAVRKIDSVLEAVADGITEEERKILYKCLGMIDRSLEAVCEKDLRVEKKDDHYDENK